LIRAIPLLKPFEIIGRVTVPSLLGNRVKGASRKRTVD
jgi:hypothetical protein